MTGREFGNLVILIVLGIMGTNLLVQGRKHYKEPQGRQFLNPYLRALRRFMQKPSQTGASEVSLTKVVRFEGMWAIVSGLILVLLSGIGLIAWLIEIW